ncbi:hypothetical protein [Bradyrhizobium retamae]|uniref:hypothetical protein n=1 Tax=Bradyrhizobium retamae TaxID=1300035 RepID=UPI0018D2190D|nr:hypothetical protein [Bradyrhizobium retamae]
MARATQLSLSQNALDRLMAAFKQGPDAAQQALDAWSQAAEDRFADRFAAAKADMAVARAEMQRSFAATNDQMQENVAGWLKRAQESYVKWQNTTPVPAVQLTAAEIADVLKKAAPIGVDPSKIGDADAYIFALDGKQYTFKKDGTAWVNDAGVPTSEEQKQDVLAIMANDIRSLTDYLRDYGGVDMSLVV